jgi:hypothetical protein
MVPILHAYDRQVPDRTVMAFVPDEERRQVKSMTFWSKGEIDEIFDRKLKG